MGVAVCSIQGLGKKVSFIGHVPRCPNTFFYFLFFIIIIIIIIITYLNRSDAINNYCVAKDQRAQTKCD